MRQMFQPQGAVNNLLLEWGWIDNPLPFWTNTMWARVSVILINCWVGIPYTMLQVTGVLQNVPSELYEAAKIDGANRWQQCWHVTLSGIKPIIAINLIMQVGSILSTNSDLILLLYTPATYDVADVIGTYTYRMGILNGEYSFTTAAGLFMSVIGFALTYICNKISNKLTGFGLW